MPRAICTWKCDIFTHPPEDLSCTSCTYELHVVRMNLGEVWSATRVVRRASGTHGLSSYSIISNKHLGKCWAGLVVVLGEGCFVLSFDVCCEYQGGNVCPKGHQKLVATVRLSTRDWSSFQLAITTHQQSFTHNGIARGAKIPSPKMSGWLYMERCTFSSYFALRKNNTIISKFLLYKGPVAPVD